jgi:hypothetical protein
MALVSRELAIIMLVTAALGVIGVFPLISSALMAAQALLWLQQAAGSSHSHDTIYCIAIATIVFALIQIIVLFMLTSAAEPVFNYRALFGSGSSLASFANGDGSIDVKFNNYLNLCDGYTLYASSGSSSVYGFGGNHDVCINGVGRLDGFYRWALAMSAYNIAICVAHIALSSLAINRIKAESAVAASLEGAYAKVHTGDA